MTDMKLQVIEDQFAVLQNQETEIYSCTDYLNSEYQHTQLEAKEIGSEFECLPSDTSSGSSGSLNEVWREKICEWCYQVVDHFDFSREVVDVTMSFLDRYLGTRRVNKKIFQLSAMTCLYLAIKLYEPSSLKISSLIGLSRGFFTVEHIVAMEQSILRALEWRMSPPSVMSAVRYYVAMLGPDVQQKAKTDIVELSRFMSELSVCDYFFVTKKPTLIALACVLTSFEGISHDRLHRKHRQKFVNEVYRITKVNCTIEEVHECRIRLRDVYQRGNYHKPKDDPSQSERASGGQSPDNVTRHVGGNDENLGDCDKANANSQLFQQNPVLVQSGFVSAEPMEQ